MNNSDPTTKFVFIKPDPYLKIIFYNKYLNKIQLFPLLTLIVYLFTRWKAYTSFIDTWNIYKPTMRPFLKKWIPFSLSLSLLITHSCSCPDMLLLRFHQTKRFLRWTQFNESTASNPWFSGAAKQRESGREFSYGFVLSFDPQLPLPAGNLNQRQELRAFGESVKSWLSLEHAQMCVHFKWPANTVNLRLLTIVAGCVHLCCNCNYIQKQFT